MSPSVAPVRRSGSIARKVPRGRDDEQRLTADIIELARQYGRYGYRKIAELLRQAGWTINDKRVERIDHISVEMRAVVGSEWPELARKLPPKKPQC